MSIWSFPLVPHSKEPAVQWRNPENQSPWTRGAHVGIDCGRSGLVVVDCDTDKETGIQCGREEFHHWMGWVEPTFTVQTPSGGTHYYYRAREGWDIRNSAGRTRKVPHMPHVDVRGIGGFVVAPLAMGGLYEPVNTIPPITLPRALCEALSRPEPPPIVGPVSVPRFGHGYAEKALEGEVRELLSTGQGGRNDRLNTAAFNLGTLIAAGALDPRRAEDVLTAAARMIGLPDREIRKTLASGFMRGTQAAPRQGRNQ